MTIETFEAFGFAEPLARALTQCGYQVPTPIQQQALAPQLQGRDLLGLAETGSGKTATFVLPILQKMAAEPVEPGSKQVQALILAPTRELAIQIDQEVASLARNMRIRRAVVLGGVGKGPQINALKRGVHVLVATPGRLLDLVNIRTCDLSRVNTLVLDEADRMFDMGFIRDIKKIVALIPATRRTALFSATMPTEIKKFAYDVLNDPFRVDLSTKTMVVDRIDQKVMIVRTPEKQSRLHTLLADEACKRVIVFTRTKRGADRVADRLGMASISASAFHGNKAQNARQRALNDFMMGHIRVLVATDIAARGIDVSNITHVVNFDMPLDPETYVHRVGRTARKGTSGIAISLCDPSERQEIVAIERMMKQKLEVIDDVGGEVLPMPERRPRQNAQNGPRREGGRHRDGERARDGGHRDGGHRGERRDHHRSRDAHSDGAPARHSDSRRHRQSTDIAAEGDAMFGTGTRPEREPRERRPARSHSDRPHRGERRSHEHNSGAPRNGSARTGERTGGERIGSERNGTERNGSGEHRAHGHRHRDDRPAHHGKSSRPEHGRPTRSPEARTHEGRSHEGRRHEGSVQEGRGHEGAHAHARSDDRRPNEHRKPSRRHGEERGDRRPGWSSSDAPKFMKSRRNDDGRGRQSRNPAS